MLINFKIGNYRSIAETQSLSMVPSNNSSLVHKTGSRFIPEVMRSASIFGPNGSGKSNIVRGMRYFQSLVDDSARFNSNDSLPHEPFILDQKLLAQPTTAEIIFVHGEDIWRYGFSADAEVIHKEWLVARSLETSRERKYFERSFKRQDSTYETALGTEVVKYRTLLEKRTNRNQLFLSKLDQFGAEEVRNVFGWIVSALRIISSTHDFTKGVTAKYCTTEANRAATISFLQSVGVQLDGINISLEEHDVPERDSAEFFNLLSGLNKGPDSILHYSKSAIVKYDVEFQRKGRNQSKIAYELAMESLGTKNLFALAGPILQTLRYGFTLIVDELNQSFHTEALRYIVELFHSQEANNLGAQLVFTSHDSVLMNRSERDLIWFCQKKLDGATELYALSDFADREGKPIRKEGAFGRQYLQGRFNALPEVDILKSISTIKDSNSEYWKHHDLEIQ